MGGVLVCYDDFTYDVINDYCLEYLVTTGCIVGFDKSGHWVKQETPPTPADTRTAGAIGRPVT